MPEYEKDCSPSTKGQLGEGQSFLILKNPQGAAPLPLLRKNEWAEIAERGFCEEARALVRGKGRGLRSWRKERKKLVKKQDFLYKLKMEAYERFLFLCSFRYTTAAFSRAF
ncbi:hypothetical protein GLW04_14325 [Halobacillus litoralis]|uniref:Uncharacterized protein n=1 Tax=Halobacillus litoralis TaxID=45668 RepID=A0A845DUK3_9BACI|nr:hypothetical protein [Halobacillus litoralis]